MRWPYGAAAALAAAVLIWVGIRIFADGRALEFEVKSPTPAASDAPAPLANEFYAFSPGTPAAAARPPPSHPLPPRVVAYMEDEFAHSAVTREALTQIAYGWSRAIHDVQDPRDAKMAGDAIAEGIACALNASVLAKAGFDELTMLDRITNTRAVMLDTEADTLAYIRFQSLAGGQYFDDPGSDSCRFNPAALSN
jgi:hypothetical protein